MKVSSSKTGACTVFGDAASLYSCDTCVLVMRRFVFVMWLMAFDHGAFSFRHGMFCCWSWSMTASIVPTTCAAQYIKNAIASKNRIVI
jgi:hypothetical protein